MYGRGGGRRGAGFPQSYMKGDVMEGEERVFPEAIWRARWWKERSGFSPKLYKGRGGGRRGAGFPRRYMKGEVVEGEKRVFPEAREG